MGPFFQPDRLWPAGHRQLQLMIIPDLGSNPELADFLTQCRTVMAEHPRTVEPIPDDSLHLTVQPIGFPGHGHIDNAIGTRFISALDRARPSSPRSAARTPSPAAPAPRTWRSATPAATAPSDDLQRQLRKPAPGHATLTVSAVDLVETIQVPHRCRYDSTALHRFTLAATTPDHRPARAIQGASA